MLVGVEWTNRVLFCFLPFHDDGRVYDEYIRITILVIHDNYYYRKQYDYLYMSSFKDFSWTYWASKVENIVFGVCVGGEDRDKIQSQSR